MQEHHGDIALLTALLAVTQTAHQVIEMVELLTQEVSDMPRLADAGIHPGGTRNPEDENLPELKKSDIQGHDLKIIRILFDGLNANGEPTLLVRAVDTVTGATGKVFIPGTFTHKHIREFFRSRPAQFTEDQWYLDCRLEKIVSKNGRDMWIVSDPEDGPAPSPATNKSWAEDTPTQTDTLPF